MLKARKKSNAAPQLAKARTGIAGLDQITHGGLPRGRATLVCGDAGCGKTLFAIEFLVRGALEFGEPGVLMVFEESAQELTENVRSLGVNLDRLVAQKKLVVDHVRVERSELEENGEYDLEALFIRLGFAIDSIGAKRVVLDTIESLFAGFSDTAVLRAELRRLFRWLKDRGVTAVVTGERAGAALTRQGLEEYISDCVILLDHRVNSQMSTRRLRIVKYRGSVHGTNEYPFLIDETGFSVLPITAMGLEHAASVEKISTGVPQLDQAFGGQGFYRGSGVLVSGTAGTGKTTLAAHLVDAACRRGERCIYFAFEESERQLVRNMRSIGIDLDPWIRKGLLLVHAARPTLQGLEAHLVTMHKVIDGFGPEVVVLDPISNFTEVGSTYDAGLMVLRLVDHLKSAGITALFTNLTPGGDATDATDIGISSLIDVWIVLRDIELGGERSRGICILKARGLAHSQQVREFILTGHGFELLGVCTGPSGMLTGSMREAHEARSGAEGAANEPQARLRSREIERRRRALEARIALMRVEFDAVADEAGITEAEDRARDVESERERRAMVTRRGGNGMADGERKTGAARAARRPEAREAGRRG